MNRTPPMRSHQGIHVESLAEQTYRLLREDIIQGRMRPGERIREKVLSERLGVSRTPIREALLKLQMAGVVVCNSRRSYNVRLLTLTEVRETFEIQDRKSTRLNSSHVRISYAVFCLKKNKL